MGADAGPTAAEDWDVWSTRARVVVDEPHALADAVTLVRSVLWAVDRAASRFRDDSELMTVPAGEEVAVSPLLADLVATALDVARRTDGAVDPTVGSAMSELGYDADLREVRLRTGAGGRPVAVVRPVPGWRRVRLAGRRLTVPPGVLVDLGASAKARAADLAAEAVRDRLGVGVLVDLGGDLATAGTAPAGGWQVEVRDGPDEPATVVSLPAGAALATSSTLHRTWRAQGETRHHVVDPRTSRPARTPWRTVSAVAPTCVAANACTTATLARGAGGAAWLAAQGVPHRLVGSGGRVHLGAGWPDEWLPAPPATPRSSGTGVAS